MSAPSRPSRRRVPLLRVRDQLEEPLLLFGSPRPASVGERTQESPFTDGILVVGAGGDEKGPGHPGPGLFQARRLIPLSPVRTAAPGNVCQRKRPRLQLRLRTPPGTTLCHRGTGESRPNHPRELRGLCEEGRCLGNLPSSSSSRGITG